MARIELRHCTIRIKDGLSGTAVVNEASPMAGDTNMDVSTVALNTNDTDLIPVGARFTVDGGDTIYTVTGRTPSSASPTTNIVFTPAIPMGEVPSMSDVITFLPQQIEVKIGEGNLTYTENDEYIYDLDRGQLDTVREGDEQPMDVNLEFVYEFITTGTGELITPMDAIKRKNGASEWVSASPDLCEPYAVDIEVEHSPPCGGAQKEITLFPDFRAESRDVNFQEASVSIAGRCNASEPIVTREDQ